MWLRASSRWPVDASIHAASKRALARSSGRADITDRVERGQDPLGASAVAEHDPGPAEPVDDARAPAAGRARRSTPTRRRCWRARRGRRPDGRAWRLLRTPAVEASAVLGEPRGVRGERAIATVRPPPSPRGRTPGCCRAAGSGPSPDSPDRVGGAAASRRRRRSRSERLASRPTTSIAALGRHVEGLQHELHRWQRRTACERGESPEAALVVGEQQVVAPPDRRPQ